MGARGGDAGGTEASATGRAGALQSVSGAPVILRSSEKRLLNVIGIHDLQ
eukprot:NODE_13011_length_251_cov_83.392857.p2 GENE.NODE_13011_length_251_cov_83.392857~~NODE_13011_length_251_cov_83.392857.p2  ORF type:complete len:50 (+),score=7.97 NODE_13011_length_251_cov_83.392857:3-152(+)